MEVLYSVVHTIIKGTCSNSRCRNSTQAQWSNVAQNHAFYKFFKMTFGFWPLHFGYLCLNLKADIPKLPVFEL